MSDPLPSPEQRASYDAAFTAARAAFPELSVPFDRFASHLAERVLPKDAGAANCLEGLDTNALYLTCGCLLGLDSAIETFERRYFGEINRVVNRFGGASAGDEVKQRLRTRLLVAESGKLPRIAAYTGRGDLLRWLKVVATREALAMLRSSKREISTDDSLLAQAVEPAADQELAYLKQHYRAEFKVAFESALAELEPRQRTILRYSLIDDLSIDEIGLIYGVHRATAARWLERVRETLLERTRAKLMAGIKVDVDELESIMRLIRSQLDVSLRRVLVEGDPDEP